MLKGAGKKDCKPNNSINWTVMEASWRESMVEFTKVLLKYDNQDIL